MTDEAGEAAHVRSPSETETAETGGPGSEYWGKRRRLERGGVFAPVAPEKRVLTERQEAFARHVARGLSPGAAAKLVGYLAKNEGTRLRRLPQVRAAIHRYREIRWDKLASVAPDVVAEIMLNPDTKPETRLKAAIYVSELAGHVAKTPKDRGKDNENNDMREWSIEALEAFLTERERSKRKSNASDAVLIAPDGTMDGTQAIEKTQETQPVQGSAVEDEAPAGQAEPA